MLKVFKKLLNIIIQFVLITLAYVIFIFVGFKQKKVSSQTKTLQKVVSISEVDKKGGASLLAYKIHKKLLEMKIESTIFAGMITKTENNIYPISTKTNLLIRSLKKLDLKYKFDGLLMLSSFDILKNKLFNNADIIHLHNLHVNYFSKFALPKISASKPTIWTLHDTLDLFEDYPDLNSKTGELETHLDLSKRRKILLKNLSEKIVNNSYLTIVTPSKWLMGKAKRGIFKNCDVRLIYNGADQTVFRPYNKEKVRKELGLPIDKKILLFSAAWGLTAGTKDSLSTILKMYNEVSKDPGIFFTIIGGGDIFFKENSITIPYITDPDLLAKYYAAADLFVYPSLWDNCPLAVIENMATGTPIITYNTGGIPELVEHMKSGYIAKYNNSDDFLKGVQLFIKNDELRTNAGTLSMELFLKNFTFEAMFKKYVSLYTEMLQN